MMDLFKSVAVVAVAYVAAVYVNKNFLKIA